MALRASGSHDLAREWLPRIASFTAISVGLYMLVGWMLNAQALTGPFPGIAAMDPRTAIGVTMAGFSMRLLHLEGFSPWVRRIARISRLTVALIGLLALAEHVLAVRLGIFRSAIVPGSDATPEMPAGTAINFCILGGALIVFGARRNHWVSQALSMAAILFSVFALLHHIYSAPGGASPMTVHAALTFAVLGAGVLWANSHRGFMAVLTNDAGSSSVANRLLPLAIIAPVVLGYLSLIAERNAMFSADFGRVLQVFTSMLAAGLVIWVAAARLARAGDARWRTERAVLETEQKYRGLFENSNDIVLLIDLQGKLTAINKSGERVLGARREDLLGRDVFRMLASDSVESMRGSIRHALLGEAVPEREVGFQVNGRCFRINVRPVLFFQDGKGAGIQAIAREAAQPRPVASAAVADEQLTPSCPPLTAVGS